MAAPGWWNVIGVDLLAQALQAEGVYVLDADRRIIAWNDAAERITGFTARDVVGRLCREDVLCHVDAHGASLCEARCPATWAIDRQEEQTATVYLHKKDRTLLPITVRVVPITLATGERGAIETFVDSDHASADTLRNQAMIDALTGLPNRWYYDRMVADMLAERERVPANVTAWGIVLLDGDGLKDCNDTWGHQAGDEMIRALAGELQHTVRRMDFLARWAGDEFVLLVRRCDGIDQLVRIAERLRLAARRVRRPDGSRLTASIGGAMAAAVGTEPERSVFARADAALKQAKEAGRDTAVVV